MAFKLLVNPELLDCITNHAVDFMFRLIDTTALHNLISDVKQGLRYKRYYVKHDSPQNKSVLVMLQALKDFTSAVVHYAAYYVPKDTGNLLDSLYVEQINETTMKVAFDLNQAPYGLYVHEIPTYHHDAPTKYKFLEDAVYAAASDTGIDFFKTNVVISEDELSVTINGDDDNASDFYKNAAVHHIYGEIPEFSDISTSSTSLRQSFGNSTAYSAFLEYLYAEQLNKKVSNNTPHYGSIHHNYDFSSLTDDKKAGLARKYLANVNTGDDYMYEMHKSWAEAASAGNILTVQSFKFPTIEKYLKINNIDDYIKNNTKKTVPSWIFSLYDDIKNLKNYKAPDQNINNFNSSRPLVDYHTMLRAPIVYSKK